MQLDGYAALVPIATGSTGTVYRAHQSALGRDVAIKALDPALAADPGFRERFRAEARLLAGLRDEHIATVYEYHEEDDGAWIVQEWIEGSSLESVLDSHGPLTAEQSLGVVRGALQGLATAHRSDIAHGDISTSNILVTADGVSTLIDFGLAGPSGSRGVIGTPAFMSPETATDGQVTLRSDVYAATAVLVRLLSGAVPSQVDQSALAAAHGDRIAAVVRRGLAEDPAQRPRDAAELLALLEEAARRRYGAGWLTRASVAGLAGTAAAAAGPSSAGQAPRAEDTVVLPEEHGAAVAAKQSGKAKLIAVGAATALVAAGAIGIAVSGGADDGQAGIEGQASSAENVAESAPERIEAFSASLAVTRTLTAFEDPNDPDGLFGPPLGRATDETWYLEGWSCGIDGCEEVQVLGAVGLAQLSLEDGVWVSDSTQTLGCDTWTHTYRITPAGGAGFAAPLTGTSRSLLTDCDGQTLLTEESLRLTPSVGSDIDNELEFIQGGA